MYILCIVISRKVNIKHKIVRQTSHIIYCNQFGSLINFYVYSNRINHLILADPWGFTNLPPEIENGQFVSPSGRVIPWWFMFLFKIYNYFNPLALFRLGGRYTLGIIKRRRQDICQPFNILWENEEENITGDYLHQANLHTPRLVHGCGLIPSLLF